MDFLRDKSLHRLENLLGILNNVTSLLKVDVSTSELGTNDFAHLDNEDEVIDYAASAITKYVVSLCNDHDLSEKEPSDKIEESVESQKLVEHECNQIYSSTMALFFKKVISSETLTDSFYEKVHSLDSGFYHSTDDSDPDHMIYSKTEVSNLLRIRPCRLVLEIVSDCPLENLEKLESKQNLNMSSGVYVGINYRTHGSMVLKRFVTLCSSVCPLKSQNHIDYIKSHLSHSGPVKRVDLSYLNCSQPWIVYWSLHSLCILGEDISPYKQRAINTLMSCWDPELGGFGGGPGQKGHLATTYASLCCLKMFKSVELVESNKLYSFLMDMKLENGAFSTTYAGESDSRSTYCAVASAHIAGILTEELKDKTVQFLKNCQTYEGGLSAEPGLEAHAGYTYCGLSALAILNELERIDLDKLYFWCLRRITSQFGFQGRPHKLVDSCYSFWIGGSLEILNNYSKSFFPVPADSTNRANVQSLFNFGNLEYHQGSSSYPSSSSSCSCSPSHQSGKGENTKDVQQPSTEREGRELRLYEHLLRCYILVVSQTPRGFRDKPNKPPDLYHTCYALSYLNIITPLSKRKHDILLNILEIYIGVM